MTALSTRKLNIGGGLVWKKDGWEVLDAMKGDYSESWQHRGSVWDTKLPSGVFDIVYTSHTLEHITHFKIEQSIAEINRLLKTGGVLRLSVPDLEKAARAYLDKDTDYFHNDDIVHPTGHLGFGSMFLNLIISPGHQTLAFDPSLRPLGSYGHTYSYDFEMLRILLEKWGFCDVTRSGYCLSSLEELRQPYALVHQGKLQPYTVLGHSELKNDKDCYLTGFDNKPGISLYVEARKEKDVPYSRAQVYAYNQRGSLDVVIAWKVKGMLFSVCSVLVDWAHRLYRKARGSKLPG